MKIKIKADSYDKSHSPFLKDVVQSIANTVAEQYKKYDATITHVLYDSARTGRLEAAITFEVVCKGFYPKFSITIPLSISLKPIHLANRRYRGDFTLGGVSQEFITDLDVTYDVETSLMVWTEGETNSADDKVNELFKRVEDRIAVWKSMVVASDIFMF